MTFRRVLIHFVLISVILLTILISGIKVWPSDRYPWPSVELPLVPLLAYFPSPLLLLSAIFLILLARYLKSGYKVYACLIFVSTIIPLSFVARENRFLLRDDKKTRTEASQVRVMQWNVWSNRMGVKRIAEEIADQQPDVICFNEARSSSHKESPPYARCLGGAWYECSEGNLLILSRSPVHYIRSFRWPGIQGLQVLIQSETPFTLLHIDIRSSPLLYRKITLEPLSNYLRNRAPDLVVGDFNTPEDSYLFRTNVERHYSDAYSVAGKGLAYTWPSWTPTLRIDLILAKNPVSILRHRVGFTLLSDHRWQWVDFSKAIDKESTRN